LEDSNIKLSSVLSKAQGVVGSKLIDKLCRGNGITMDDIEEVYHGKIEASKEEMYEACQGTIEEPHIYMLKMILKDIDSTNLIIPKIRKELSITHPTNFKSVVILNHHSYCYVSIGLFSDLSLFECSLRNFLAEFR